jgi:cell division protein FtsB
MRFLIALLAVLLLALQAKLWLGEGGVLELRELRHTVVEREARLEQLARRNQQLAAEVADLQQGLDAIEERARTELGMIGRHEVFYLVVE